MDVIYKVKKTPLISIENQFDNFKAHLPVNGFLPNTRTDLRELVNFAGDDKEFSQLEESVSLNNLSQDDDLNTLKLGYLHRFREKAIIEIPKKALRLKTFQELLKKRRQCKTGGCFGTSEFSFKKVVQEQGENVAEIDLQPFEDVVISIRFYRPFKFQSGVPTFGPRFAEEFLVLGTNKLCELRDKISCICNNRCLFDMSEDPYQDPPTPKANPGFFFITDTFYNDTRNPLNHDYSAVIRDWLNYKKQFKDIEFKTAKMEETRFMDLTIRLGFPQVYQHHGNCEHLFTFSSIRLLSPFDDLNRAQYPSLRTVSYPHVILCHICASRVYTFIVKSSNRQFHDPTYLCRVCFESYYYVDGKKICDFEVYQLNPDEIIDTIPQEEDESEDDDDEESEDVDTDLEPEVK